MKFALPWSTTGKIANSLLFKKQRTFLMMPLYFETILVIWQVWAFQVRLLSMKIPRNLVVSTCSIPLSSISILKFHIGLLLYLFLKIMKLVLSIFNESLFILNRLDISFKRH